MTETKTEAPRSGIAGFLTTVPGILTAMAGLVTAVVGAYLAVNQGQGPDKGPPPAPAPVVVNLTTPGSSVPPSPDTADAAHLRLAAADAGLFQASAGSGTFLEEQAYQCDQGDDDACVVVLDTLFDYCTDGSGAGCDALWQVSPEGSVYEAYGATCGGRVPEVYAGRCSEL